MATGEADALSSRFGIGSTSADTSFTCTLTTKHLRADESNASLLRVKNGPTAMSAWSPQYPELRTLVGAAGRSLVGANSRREQSQQNARARARLIRSPHWQER